MNHNQCKEMIRNLTPFKSSTGSLYGVKFDDRYVVYSYGTHFPIAVHCDNHWYINTDRRSATTSKHQAVLRQALCDSATLQIRLPMEIVDLIAEHGYTAVAKARVTGKIRGAFNV